MDSQYPLQRTWGIWEMWDQSSHGPGQNFQEKMRPLGTFSDVHTFWQYWNYIPHSNPPYLFPDPKTKEKVLVGPDKNSIQAIGVFEHPIQPAWEDPVNQDGFDIAVRGKFDAAQIKRLWGMLVFTVIGESIAHHQDIVGCRVVDKVNQCKFQIWGRHLPQGQENSVIEELKQALKSNVFNQTKLDDFQVNHHQNKSQY